MQYGCTTTLLVDYLSFLQLFLPKLIILSKVLETHIYSTVENLMHDKGWGVCLKIEANKHTCSWEGALFILWYICDGWMD